MAAPELYTWPPGTVDRFHMLRRATYCGAVSACLHKDPTCCCGYDCCCSNLVPPTEASWRLAFAITGDLVCSGYLKAIQGECNWEGSDPTEFDCTGSGDCDILEILDMLLYCPAGESTPDKYRLEVVVDTICGTTLDVVVNSGASCGPPPSLIFDFTANCEGDIDCDFTVTFSTNPYLPP